MINREKQGGSAEQFQHKYRIASERAAWWDYGWAGAYFITVCTADRQSFFGEIQAGNMHLSIVGALADVFWHEIRQHAKQVELGAFVVMPNHVHGILILNENNSDVNANNDDVETRHALSLQSQPPPSPQRFQNQFKTKEIITFRL